MPEYRAVVLNETELTRPQPSTIHQVPITHEQPTHLPTTHTSSIHTPTPTIQKLKTTNHQRPTHLSLIHSSTHLTKIHYCTLTTFLYTQQPTNCLHTQPPPTYQLFTITHPKKLPMHPLLTHSSHPHMLSNRYQPPTDPLTIMGK